MGTGQIATSRSACLMTNLPFTQLSKRNAKPMLTSPSTLANVVYVFKKKNFLRLYIKGSSGRRGGGRGYMDLLDCRKELS